MPSRYLTSNGDENIQFECATEHELDRFSRKWYRDKYLIRPNGERRIAGSKRVERYQQEHHGHNKYSGQGPLLQSITAHPALSTPSFEELRVECYAQSFITQGKPPTSVDAVVIPEAVIPPLFNAYSDETGDILPNEITMAN